MQSELALSATESEHIVLSSALRDVIPIKGAIEDINRAYKLKSSTPIIICKLFEDNNSALELANAPKIRPRTKYIAVKYRHFRSHVQNGSIKIKAIDTTQQQVDMLTKPLTLQDFVYIRKLIMGW